MSSIVRSPALGGRERPFRRVCLFCGSARGRADVYREAADRLGRTLAERGIGLVYGGGDVGLMGVAADAAIARGGEVVGVIPRRLVQMEVAHRGISELIVVETMHERKARMTELSDAFVALPGGIGTMDELFESLTWAQLGYHDKPVGLLNTAGFFDPLLALLDHYVAEGFLSRPTRERLIVERDDPGRLLDALRDRRGESRFEHDAV